MTMTFQQFQESKQAVADLGDFFGDECLKGASGFVYLDQLWIEETTSWPVSKRVDGRYYTLIGRREYQSDFIQDCEEPLYQFALEEILTD